MSKTIRSVRKTVFLLVCFCFTTFSVYAQKILITYYSESGHTSLLAKSVADGAQKISGAEVRLLTIDKTSANDLIWADAIIVGSPVHSANVAAAVQEFIKTWPFNGQELKDKIGAVFVTGGGISAGEELAQMNLIHTLMVFNMIIVGGPSWDQPFGASAVTGEEPFSSENGEISVDPRFLAKGSALGERVSRIAKKFSK